MEKIVRKYKLGEEPDDIEFWIKKTPQQRLEALYILRTRYINLFLNGIGSDFREFIQLLNENNVEYIVVGGYAVAVHGFPRYTGDIDFWVKPTKPNAEKLEKVIIDFGFGSLDIEKEDFLKENYVIQLGYPPNRIDIMTGISGLSFDECWEKKR